MVISTLRRLKQENGCEFQAAWSWSKLNDPALVALTDAPGLTPLPTWLLLKPISNYSSLCSSVSMGTTCM